MAPINRNQQTDALLCAPAFHRGDNDDVEREYDRLRDLARAENDKAHQCSQRVRVRCKGAGDYKLTATKSQEAYKSGDHNGSHNYSQQSKEHYQKRDDYNRQAAEYIFRENNAAGHVDGDTIDLHGLYVEEAERIIEERIRSDRARGQTHLHAIVGKGNHSAGHVQRIKPKVEEICHELGLKYRTEENAGRIYINLQGGEPVPPSGHGGQQNGGYQGGQPHHGGGQQHGGQQHGGQHGNQQQDEIEQFVEKLLPRLMRKLEKACCTVM